MLNALKWGRFMELAKVTSKGQITIPIVGLETEEDVVAMIKELRKERTVK